MSYNKDEHMLETTFWRSFNADTLPWIGFNIFNFDLPFLILRSMKLGVAVPPCFNPGDRWVKWDRFIDVMNFWTLGRREERISLDKFARFLGVGKKEGSGKDFAALLATDRAKASEYLENDLKLTKLIYERFTIFTA